MQTKTLTNNAVFGALNALGEVYQQPLKVRTMQRVRKAIGALQEEAQTVTEIRQRLEEENEEEDFEAALQELGQTETEVDVPALRVDELEDVRLTGPQLSLLEVLFAEESPAEKEVTENGQVPA